MKEQVIIILEAIRAAQCTLGRCRQSNVTVEQLRDILCSARVDSAVRALSYQDSPSIAPAESLLRREQAGQYGA